ncbi:hypothetical protein L6R52_27730 [Myxococcota bacterium]|nr:hypothetical protein [Myxococcota bacterium]
MTKSLDGLFALPLTLLLACNEAGVDPLGPTRLDVDARSLDFGDVLVGSFSRKTVTARVTGATPISIDAPDLRDQPRWVFEVSMNIEPGRLRPGTAFTLDITYAPPTLGEDSARLTVPFTGGGDAALIELRGRAICPSGQHEVAGRCVDPTLTLDAGTVDAAEPDAAEPPPDLTEVCDGRDNDGDQRCDEHYGCCAGTSVACTTVCGSRGSGTCTSSCGLPDAPACTPPSTELCNGLDDTCDGRLDEGCPNYLTNFEFEDGLAHWGHWVDTAQGAQATVSVDPNAGFDGSLALRIDVTGVGTQHCGAYPCAHFVEVRQVGLPAVEGTRPRISFRARSIGIPSMSVGFRQLCGGPCSAPACPAVCPAGVRNETEPPSCCWEAYAGPEYSFQLSPGWQTYTYTFPAIVIEGPDTGRNDGRVLFNVGTGIGTLWIDDVHLDFE